MPRRTKQISRPPGAGVPISEARRRFFELAEDVLTGRRESVTMTHRGHQQDIVMVRARDLDKLKADLAALRASQNAAPSLRGTMTLNVPPDQVLAGVRARQAALARAKRERLFADDEALAVSSAERDGHAS